LTIIFFKGVGSTTNQISSLLATSRFVNDILELRVLFSELMEVMSRNHYEQSEETHWDETDTSHGLVIDV